MLDPGGTRAATIPGNGKSPVGRSEPGAGGGPEMETTGIADTGALGRFDANDAEPNAAGELAPGSVELRAGAEPNADGGGGNKLEGPPFSVGASGDKNGLGLGMSHESSTTADSRRTMVCSSSASAHGEPSLIVSSGPESSIVSSSLSGDASGLLPGASNRMGGGAVNVSGTGAGGAESGGAASDADDRGEPPGAVALGGNAAGDAEGRPTKAACTFVGAAGCAGVGRPHPARGAGAPPLLAINEPDVSVLAVPDAGGGGREEASGPADLLFRRSSKT
jgi:hypothetical protein